MPHSSKVAHGGFRVEASAGPTPWTRLDRLGEHGEFQFAVVGDLTGGSRPGVFESAVTKLNLLQPEFVLSVGDLIEGYSEDRERVIAEWQAFDKKLEPLEAPFFYVAGNHDISNPTMRAIWQQRYGPSHYAFEYQGVLFLCLDSMDGGMHQIGPEQLDWVSRTLAAHVDVRWTLLFLHTPLWDSPELSGSAATWQAVEARLGDRKYSVIAGHHHSYIQHVRNDRKYVTLATTGGGSALRGPRYGEFDQIAWVTMKPNGPVIANVELDAVWDENVRTAAIRQFSNALYDAGALRPLPIFFEREFRAGKSSFVVHNPGDVPLDFEISALPPEGFALQKYPARGSVGAHSSSEHVFGVTSLEAFDADSANMSVHWTLRTRAGDPWEFAGDSPLSIVRLLPTPTQGRVAVDGNVSEWSSWPLVVTEPRELRHAVSSWSGPDDAHFRVATKMDQEHLYVAVDVRDDELRAHPKLTAHDSLELRIDVRSEPARSHATESGGDPHALLLELRPSPAGGELRVKSRHAGPRLQAKCVPHTAGYAAELAIPRGWIREGNADERVRLNVAVNDADTDGVAQLWWWPDWYGPHHIPGSGTLPLATQRP